MAQMKGRDDAARESEQVTENRLSDPDTSNTERPGDDEITAMVAAALERDRQETDAARESAANRLSAAVEEADDGGEEI